MWIIPKTLSAFVPDTEGLSLGLDERAWMLEQSAMWRSKPSSKQTWLRRLKKGGWITHLSGRILKPSLHESFVEKYTDSLEDIPANHSVQQASDKEKKTQDTYGHTSSSTSGQLEMFSGASLRMLQDTPRWGYGESCPIWKKKVIDARSAYSVRKKLALHTKGNECLSLRNYPTPAARDYKGTNSEEHVLHKSKGFKGHMNQLPNFIKYGMQNWPTPVAMNDGIYVDNSPNKDKRHSQGLATQASQNWPTPRAGNPGSRKPGTGGKILAEEAKKNWPTARTSDAEGGRIETEMTQEGFRSKRKKSNQYFGAKLRDAVETHEQHNGPQDQEKSSTSGKNQESWGTPSASDYKGSRGKNSTQKRITKQIKNPQKLNPSWVEQLMGLSTGWTDLGSWGMELSPKQQN